MNYEDGKKAASLTPALADKQSDFSRLASYEGFLRAASREVHARNDKWWRDPATGLPVRRNVGELFMLMTSELGEAMEGHRKSKMDDHLPQYPNVGVEVADLVIRAMDFIGAAMEGKIPKAGSDTEFLPPMDIPAMWRDKMEFNAVRADHKHENRMKPDGKKY